MMNTMWARCRRDVRLLRFIVERTPNGEVAESKAVDVDAES